MVGLSEAEAEDNSVTCVTRVSYQQAASGAPKCTICDLVCDAIIPCATATEDEDVVGSRDFLLSLPESCREEPAQLNYLLFCFF